jgi:hypothetical protein
MFAAWYIGGDVIDLITEGMQGTNLVAHIAGALTGYYLGRWWLSDRKWLIEVELQDEIDYMKANRGDWFGISSLRLDRRTLKEAKLAEQARAHEKLFDDVLRQAHKLNEVHEHDRALELLTTGIKEYGESEETLRMIFDEVWKWTRSIFTLNFARYYISYLLARGNKKEALNVCERCFTFAPEFLLAEPLDVMPLARLAQDQQRFGLVYSLVHNAEDRYGRAINVTDATLLEVEILAYHLERPQEANAILESLKHHVDLPRRREVLALQAAIAPLVAG